MGIDIAKAALIEVDIQNDFCPAYTAKDGTKRPEGALAVHGGDCVIKPLNRIARRFVEEGGKVIASQDWHPAHHSSFASSHPGKKVNDVIVLPVPGPPPSVRRKYGEAEFIPAAIQQVLWPDHCVQNSPGAAFHDEFDLDYVNLVIRKGFRKNLDSYSVFFENDRHTSTGLDGYLRGLGIEFVFIGGLATDYCVLYSVLDAVRLGYKTTVITDAVREVGYPEGSVERAFKSMEEAGVLFAAAGDVL